ncbi:MAG: hypothetical protein ACI4QC_03145 [Thermoguttaceae bacterium]
MWRQTALAGLIVATMASVLASCEAFHSKKITEQISTEREALQRVTLPPDAVVFDVLLARIPYQDRELARDFWKDVDELEVEPEKRKQLNEQGFRVGLVGASPPGSLSKLLALKGLELRESLEEETDYSKQDATDKPATSSKPVTLRAGMKSMIETRDEVCASIPILENENGALVGKTYSDARTTLSVGIEQNADGSVQFNLAPLLKYGAPQPITRWQYGQLVRTQEQPTKSFDQLKFSVSLRPGQFLVLGASDTRTNALGKYFFTNGGEDFDQKILVLRLLVTQCDGQFDRFPDFKTLAARATGTEESYDGEDDFADFDSKDGTSSLTTGSDFDNYALEEESLFDADAQDESKTETEVSDSNTPMETSDIPDIPIFQERTQSNGDADAPTAASRESTLE